MNPATVVLAACDRVAGTEIGLHIIEFENDPRSCGPLILVARDDVEARATEAALQEIGNDVPPIWWPMTLGELTQVGLPVVSWRFDAVPDGAISGIPVGADESMLRWIAAGRPRQ